MRRSSPNEKHLLFWSMAMVWRPPTETDTIRPADSGNSTRTGELTSTLVLSSIAPIGPFCRGGSKPHWPHSLPPTQYKSPELVTKAACSRPMPICVTPPLPVSRPIMPGRGIPGTAEPCRTKGSFFGSCDAERSHKAPDISSIKKVSPRLVSRKILVAEHCTSTNFFDLASPSTCTRTGPTGLASALPSPHTKMQPSRSRAAPKVGPNLILFQPGVCFSNQETRFGHNTSVLEPPGMALDRPHTYTSWCVSGDFARTTPSQTTKPEMARAAPSLTGSQRG
mmetsp:Transcript_24595/g.47918  ORF Transcript_24595/g.47918 Transcript_24595/m.47918 type:complete len:280 (-) Transcript_24595:262-1101(-)